MCGNDYPRNKEYFNKSHWTKDKMRYECKQCQSIINAKYRAIYKQKFDLMKLISNEQYELNMKYYIGYPESYVNKTYFLTS